MTEYLFARKDAVDTAIGRFNATIGSLTSGQIVVGQASGDGVNKTVNGDGTLSLNGTLIVTKTNGAPFVASATTDTTNATNISSGTLAALRLPAFGSGDVSFATAGGAGTIAASAVTFAKFQQVAASSLVGNPTVGLATTQGITVGATLTFNGTVLQTLAHSGDVTTPNNSFATTLAKIQGTTITGTTGTGAVVLSDSPNFSTVAVLTRSGFGAVYQDGFVLRNLTVAAAGAQQFSPAFRIAGQGWRTNATAQSEQVDWTFINEPVQGTADPSSNLTFNFQVNSGGFTQKFRMASDGTFNVAAGFTVAGTALAASNLSNGVTGSGAVVLANTPTLITPILGNASGTVLTLANGTSNGLQFLALSGSNAGVAMGAGGAVVFVLGSAVDAFAVNDHGGGTVLSVSEGTPGTIASTIVSTPGNLVILSTTSIPGGGAGGKGYMFSSTANFGTFFGSGAPTVTAAKGSLYLRSDGSSTSTRAYINTDSGTTWTNLVTAA